MFYYILCLLERKGADGAMTDDGETADDTNDARERDGASGTAGVGAGPAAMREGIWRQVMVSLANLRGNPLPVAVILRRALYQARKR